jgi:uncharacterized Zn-finger protein
VKTEKEVPRFAKLDDGRFSCLTCLKTFDFLGNARVHYREKHTELKDVFSCDYCQKEFKIKRILNRHLLTKHKISQKMLKNSLK